MSGPERRRLARIPLGCVVVLREKLGTWIAETADVGARGCRIVLSRPLAKGVLVQLRFETGDGEQPLEAVGQVVWTRQGERSEAGVAFVSAPRCGTRAASWIDALAVSQIRRAARAGGGPGDLGHLSDAVLRLGVPPGGALTAGALAVARIAEREGRISDVQGGVEGLETLAALLAAATLTLGASSGDAQRWKRVLSLPPAAPTARAPAAAPRAIAPPPPPLPPLAVVPRAEADAVVAAPLRDPGAARVAAMIAETLGDDEDQAAAGGARFA